MTAHRTHPPTRAMRENPDIDQLKRQARELLEACRAQSADAVIEVAAYHRTATPETFALHDAQFVLARSYGFESWPKLKAAVDGVTTTRLHEAVQNRDLAAVRALLARRPEIVDLQRGGPSGFEIRAIHIAVMKRDVEMTRLLLEVGADTRGGIWPNRDATSPRTIAEERGYDEIVAIMAAQEEKRRARQERTPPDFAVSECAERLLQAAVRSGRLDVLRQLLETGLDPDERTQIGQLEDQMFSTGGPLMEAVNTGRIDMARVLLEHGADPNAQVFTSGSPTFAAYSGGSPRTHAPDPEMIALMLKHGGWIDAASVGYLREVEIARRMLAGELDPHLELRHLLRRDGRRTDPVEWRERPKRGHRAHGVGADRLAAGRPAMVLDAVASAARTQRPERPRTGGLPRVVSPNSRAMRSQSSDTGIRADDVARSDRARPWSGCVSGVHPAGCGSAHGGPGRILEEYASRMGVSLGPCGVGQTAAGSRGRSDRAGGGAVGHTARVGRTASTCGDFVDPPPARS